MILANRREFLRGISTLSVAGSLTSLPGLAFAALPGDARLVVVFLFGGMDGIAAIPPYGDLSFARTRPGVAPPSGMPGGMIDLDGFYGMHPALSPLQAAYQEGSFLPLHAVSIDGTGSHFANRMSLERGTRGFNTIPSGWLNRVLQHFGLTEPGSAVAMGRGIPRILRGRAPAGSWAPQSFPPAPRGFVELAHSLYENDPKLASALAQGARLRDVTNRILGDAAHDPKSWNPVRAAEVAGALLSAETGPRIAALEVGGWDTHSNQNARIAINLQVLSAGLVALRHNLGAAWRNTVVAIVTEFGRTVTFNGSAGTDHGDAGAIFLYGGAVNGGRVFADWPGLTRGVSRGGANLYRTSDIRSVFKGVLHEHFDIDGNTLDEFIFPNSRAAPIFKGLIRT